MTKETTPRTDAAVVCGTAFATSCAGFALSVLLLIPVLGTLLARLDAPALLQQVVVVLLLFGLPILAAIAGIELGEKIIRR
ncbi:hypothetical protein OT109_04055 [Phycisphaeraceae bacterium D3-23]